VSDVAVAANYVVVHDSVVAAIYACSAVDAMHLLLLTLMLLLLMLLFMILLLLLLMLVLL
jgi:hypothetical protein